jgi:F-type H+-transporting ATPase subunit delta
MNPSIQGYAAAVLGSLDDGAIAMSAQDLGSLAETVLGNASLRAALTDTSVPGAVRRDVISDLLDGKVSAPAIRLAANAAQVSHAQDVPAALSYLADRSRRAAAGETQPEPALSVLGARARVGGYASAVFEENEVATLETIEDELFKVARTIESSPELRRTLTDRDMPLARRQGVVSALFGGKVLSQTVGMLEYVVAGGRARDIVGTIDWLVDQTARARGWRVAKVRTAKALDASQADSLRASLAKVAGNPVELQVTEDETLLGGIRIEVGDLLVDATAKGRLESLREHMDAEHRSYVKND